MLKDKSAQQDTTDSVRGTEVINFTFQSAIVIPWKEVSAFVSNTLRKGRISK
jgi:hypothetical protein